MSFLIPVCYEIPKEDYEKAVKEGAYSIIDDAVRMTAPTAIAIRMKEHLLARLSFASRLGCRRRGAFQDLCGFRLILQLLFRNHCSNFFRTHRQ